VCVCVCARACAWVRACVSVCDMTVLIAKHDELSLGIIYSIYFFQYKFWSI
jgi:hypothetical protein